MLRRTHTPRVAKNIVFIGADDKDDMMDYICNKIKKKTVWKGVNVFNVKCNKRHPIDPSQIDIVVWCFDWDNLEESTKILKRYLKCLKGYDIFSLIVGFNWDGVTEERLFDKTSFAHKINPVFDYDFFVSFDDDMEDIRLLLRSYIKANDLYRCR